MINLQKMNNVNLDTPAMKAFDWILAVGTIAWGLWAQSIFLVVLGVLGCAAAWYRPLTRFRNFMNGFVQKRR